MVDIRRRFDNRLWRYVIPIVGVVLFLYAVFGGQLVPGLTVVIDSVGTFLQGVGWLRIGAGVFAVLLLCLGVSLQPFDRKSTIAYLTGVLALVTIPAVVVLLGQIVLSSTELQLVADALQSVGSLLLVLLTLSYVVATWRMNQSNREMIYEQKKDRYRSVAKRVLQECIYPLSKVISNQHPVVHEATNHKFKPLPATIDIDEALLQDMEEVEFLGWDHASKHGSPGSSLPSIKRDINQYLYKQGVYEHWYDEVFNQVVERVYRVSQTGEGPVELSEDEKEVVNQRRKELARYLLEAYPAWQREIENDRELAQVYPKLKEERRYFLDAAGEDVDRLVEVGERMFEQGTEFVLNPKTLSQWKDKLLSEYQIGRSEVTMDGDVVEGEGFEIRES